MTEDERKAMVMLADTLEGEINRMCLTKDLAEFDTMYAHARVNLKKLADDIYTVRFAKSDDETELNKLEEYLKEKGYKYKRMPRGQIIVFNQEGHRQWDAVCFKGSYGFEAGLLEVMGDISHNKNDVEGWLTAQVIIDRLEEAENDV